MSHLHSKDYAKPLTDSTVVKSSGRHLRRCIALSVTHISLGLLLLAGPMLNIIDADAKPRSLTEKKVKKSKSTSKPKKSKSSPNTTRRLSKDKPARGAIKRPSRAQKSRKSKPRRVVRALPSASTRKKPASGGVHSIKSRPTSARGVKKSRRGIKLKGASKGATIKNKAESNRQGFVNTERRPVHDTDRRSVERRKGVRSRAAQPGSRTTTTTTTRTKKTKKTKSVKTSKRVKSSRRVSKSVQRRQVDPRRDRGRDGGGFGGAPNTNRPRRCRPNGGHAMLNLGVGAQSITSEDRQTALTLGGGYRSNLLGVAGEVQLASREEEETTLTALRAQFRLYLPLGACADLYPLIGLSSFHGERENTSAIDFGLGADLNLGGVVSLGARYTHSFFTDKISSVNNTEVESTGTFIVQLGIYF